GEESLVFGGGPRRFFAGGFSRFLRPDRRHTAGGRLEKPRRWSTGAEEQAARRDRDCQVPVEGAEGQAGAFDQRIGISHRAVGRRAQRLIAKAVKSRLGIEPR